MYVCTFHVCIYMHVYICIYTYVYVYFSLLQQLVIKQCDLARKPTIMWTVANEINGTGLWNKDSLFPTNVTAQSYSVFRKRNFESHMDPEVNRYFTCFHFLNTSRLTYILTYTHICHKFCRKIFFDNSPLCAINFKTIKSYIRALTRSIIYVYTYFFLFF